MKGREIGTVICVVMEGVVVGVRVELLIWPDHSSDVVVVTGILDADNAEEKQTIKPLKWEEDMQLYSRFLDRKVNHSLAGNL